MLFYPIGSTKTYLVENFEKMSTYRHDDFTAKTCRRKKPRRSRSATRPCLVPVAQPRIFPKGTQSVTLPQSQLSTVTSALAERSYGHRPAIIRRSQSIEVHASPAPLLLSASQATSNRPSYASPFPANASPLVPGLPVDTLPLLQHGKPS
jgi:hypothetical protein